MGPADESDEDAVAAAFLVELLRDRENGRDLPVSHYQARFEGFDDVVRREFARAAAAPATTDNSSAALSEPLDLSDQHRYRIDAEVGRGGMGVVWKAFEDRLQRHLALKKVRPGASQQELTRFLEEARITAQLHHPGIVPVHDLGMDEAGQLYFTMDLVRGRTFADVLATAAPGNHNRSLEVLLRVCEAVAFAHDKGIVHRDLKPQNVMVGRFGEVYVMDWGLAHVDGASTPIAVAAGRDGEDQSVVISNRGVGDTPEWTMPGDIVGTPAYMAPEQARGTALADARSDIYAIGAMLYQMLARRLPYVEQGATESSQTILERVVTGPPLPLAEIAKDAPAELIAICEQAMARAPENRYDDVLALRDDLRAYAQGRVVHAYERGTWAELRKWVLRNRAITASAVAAVLALAIALVVSLAQTSIASTEAQKANQSFDDAMYAVETMLTRVGQHTLDNVPQATAVRRQLLQDAVKLYEKLLTERQHDAKVRRRTAAANYRVAGLHLELGERDQANAAIERALELRLTDLQLTPGDVPLLIDLAETYNQAALQAQAEGHAAVAKERYGEGLATIAKLLQQRRTALAHDQLAEALNLRGILYSNLALIAFRAKEYPQAERILQDSLADHLEVAELRGDITETRVDATHMLLGAVLRAKRDVKGARRHWQAAVDIHEQRYAAKGDAYLVRDKLAAALRNLAVSMFDQRDWPACNRTTERVLQLYRQNTEQFPDVPGCWAGLGSALTNKSQFLRQQKKPKEALRAAREAVAILEQACAKDPKSSATRHSLHLAHNNSYRSAKQASDHGAMAELALRHGQHALADRDWRVAGAHRLAVAHVLAGNDTQLSATDRAAAQARYERDALAVLNRMCDHGELTTKDLDHKVLATIRDGQGMQDLRQRVQQDK